LSGFLVGSGAEVFADDLRDPIGGKLYPGNNIFDISDFISYFCGSIIPFFFSKKIEKEERKNILEDLSKSAKEFGIKYEDIKEFIHVLVKNKPKRLNFRQVEKYDFMLECLKELSISLKEE
jgi:hypothetical protein